MKLLESPWRCGLALLVFSFLLSELALAKVRAPLPSKAEIAKLPADGGPKYNRLIFEKSPYLLQHAANPVDWYPWGKEAFERAKKEDKPVLLSVGYATCHWCHVMEHESFEDPEVAKLMNEHFICVKVDREERPDIDHLYMTVTQAMTRSGGWPMTVVMTPEKVPFFSGTYFPKKKRFGRPGMMQLIPDIAKAWKTKRKEIGVFGAKIVSMLEKASEGSPGPAWNEAVLKNAYTQMARRFDDKRAGFSKRPKFPVPHNLMFLMRYYKRTGEARAFEMVERTLDEMRRGGIYDHVGFGFHRYSTDAVWLLPHFEKMLYDQALLVIAYLEAYQITGDAWYEEVCREVLEYVMRDMSAPEGGFYSAEDADSEGEEGKFYLWTKDQVLAVLGKDDGAWYSDIFGIQSDGNYVEETTHKKNGTNIPHLKSRLKKHAERLEMKESDVVARVKKLRAKLFAQRKKRIHPLKDDKILTDWNGFMISAFARSAQVFDDQRYRELALRAADFILNRLSAKNGRLLKRYRDGDAGLPAHIEDYAFFIQGLLDVYEMSFDVKYLKAADRLTQITLKWFWDTKRGGFFLNASDGEKLLVRPKEIYDGAIPAGNSVACLNLLRLSRMTGNLEYEKRAVELFRAFSGALQEYPSQSTYLMMALEFAMGDSREIVISGSLKSPDSQKMLKELRSKFLPNKVVLFRHEDARAKSLAELSPFTANQKSMGGKSTVYVCRKFTCKAPTTDVTKMMGLLGVKVK